MAPLPIGNTSVTPPWHWAWNPEVGNCKQDNRDWDHRELVGREALCGSVSTIPTSVLPRELATPQGLGEDEDALF